MSKGEQVYKQSKGEKEEEEEKKKKKENTKK